MGKNSTILLIAGLAMVGVAAFIFLKKTAPKPDPVGNLLNAAPGIVTGVTNAGSAAIDGGSHLIKSSVGLITAGPKAVISGVKDIVSSLKFW